MKFIDGFWLLKSGVKPSYAMQIATVSEKVDGYELHVSSIPIRNRGDTLKGPVFTVNVYSPTEGVIGVKFDHFRNIERYPNIPLFPDSEPVPPRTILSKSEGSHSLTTGSLSVEITENPYTLTFKSPRHTLTRAGYRYQGLYDVPSKWTLGSASRTSCLATDPGSNPVPEPMPEVVRYIHSELNISPGELIYGFGEQFGALIKNGQSIKIWNQDGGTSSDQAYKNVPFYMTNRGYGVFINHPGEVEVEVGTEKVSRVGISVADSSLEYFIIYGDTPLDVLERYTRMTGRPAILPTWTFGLWLSTSFLTSYSTETVSGFLEGMQERNCPVRVFHIDCFWMKKYEWCSFTFDPDNFPDPKAYLNDIKERYGVKICLWINPYIGQLSPIFQEAIDGGFFIKRKDGTPWQWDLWQPGLSIVDFTNPAACEWYKGKLNALLDLGIDCFKTDFGERIPHTGIEYHDGSDPMRMHNMYAIVYNELVFNILRDRFGVGGAVLFARSGFAGGQRFPVHWGGDCESTWEAMAETIRGCLSLTVSGYGFASHDIGGFEGHPPPEIYQRWVAFGLFSSHSRLHGSSSYRVPWNYGEEAAKSMSKLLNLRHRLMPYMYDLALLANEKGHPIQRAMFLQYPEDRTSYFLDRQYMLGPSLLVAPVFNPQEEDTEYYLPAGTWISFGTALRVVKGPIWIKEKVPLDEIPAWVPSGTILLLGPDGIGRPDYEYGKNVSVHIYGLEDGRTAEAIIRGSEISIIGSIRAERRGKRLIVSTAGVCTVSVLKVFAEDVEIKFISGGSLTGQEKYCATTSVEAGATEVVCEFE